MLHCVTISSNKIAIDADIHKNNFGSRTTTLVISNEEMNNTKKVKFLEEPGLLRKGVYGTIESKAKEEIGGFLGMLLGTFGTSLLGNVFCQKSRKTCNY